MVLILVTGYALANSVPVARALTRLASVPRSAKGAVSLTFLISAVACWLNWGFGLVVAGLLAREIARRIRIDFEWLVAAAYSGFLVWASGWSGSIALAQSTPGSKLNIVQAMTGQVLPIQSMLLPWVNLAPVIALLVILPFVLRALQPEDTLKGGRIRVTGSIGGAERSGRHAHAGAKP